MTSLPRSMPHRVLVFVFLTAWLGATAMARIDATWNGGAGNWNSGPSWSGGAVPNNNGGNFFSAFVDGGNAAVSTVTIPGSQVFTVDRLVISGGDTVFFANNSDFVLTQDNARPGSGEFVNDGAFTFQAGGSFTDLRIERPVTLSGTGTMTLNGSTARILDEMNSGIGYLTITGGTIAGVGQIGANSMSFTNQVSGLIHANVLDARLIVDPRGGVDTVNQGTFRASNGGILRLTGNGGGGFNNTGGTIEALDASAVELISGAAVSGGTLRTVGTGEVVVPVSTTAALANVSVQGRVRLQNNSDLVLSGTINNQNELVIDAGGSFTDVRIEGGDVQLTGSGVVRLQGGNGRILDENNTGLGHLLNQGNTIQGFGSLGSNSLRISNSGTSVIQANVAAEVLVIDPRNLTDVQNDGILRATGGGILRLHGNGGGGFVNNNATGVMEALDGSTIEMTAGASIRGGVLRITGSGEFVVPISNTAAISDVRNQGMIRVRNNSDLSLAGTIQNSGSILVDSAGSFTDIRVDGGTVDLNGGGTLTMTGPNGRILDEANTGLGVLRNLDGTIQGRGNLGANTAQLRNAAAGVIQANSSGNRLVIDPRGGSSLENDGVLRAVSGGVLQLSGNGGGGFANGPNGVVEALAGSTVELVTGAAVSGGTLKTTGDGEILVIGSNQASIANLTLQGQLRVENNSDLFLAGTINNQGTMTLDAAGSFTDLRVEGGTVDLIGGGTLNLLGGNGRILDEANTGLGFLRNLNGTIQGLGNIGFNLTQLRNAAGSLIQANSSGNRLVIDPRGGTAVDNDGTLRAVSGGILRLTGNGGGGFVNGTNGVVEALAGSVVELATGAAVSGGTLKTSGNGELLVVGSSQASIANLTLQGQLRVENNSDLFLAGTINNQGTMTLDAAGSFTDFRVEGGDVTLVGGGSLILRGSNARMLDEANSGAGHVINQTQTIQGQGSLGSNVTRFTNLTGGVIDANVPGGTLAIDPRNGSDVVNEGLLRASAGGTLHLTGNGGGGFVNRNGGRCQIESRFEISGTSLRNQAGGRIEGTGTVATLNGGLLLNEAGVVAPGSSFGVLTVQGNFQQLTDGRLEIELGGHAPGTDQDQLVVSGQAALSGILDVNPSAAITDPAARGTIESFVVMTFGTRAGGFAQIDYNDALLNATFTSPNGDIVAYAGPSGTSGLDGMFRRIRYGTHDAIFSNYLALPGDANGDGNVDGSDFNIWNANKFTTGTNWTTGDFNRDGQTDGSDFGIWNANKFTSAGDSFRLVPEPGSWGAWLGIGTLLIRRGVFRGQSRKGR